MFTRKGASSFMSGKGLAEVPESGAIIARILEGDPQILLVTAKQNPAYWIFPKGHIEPGESAGEAALREAREEAGIIGSLLGCIGSLNFEVDHRPFRVDYFLVKFLSQGTSWEDRRQRWCAFDDAMKLLSFEDARGLLEKSAWPMIRKQFGLPQ
jgi:8-oxo-dGTP pyrophosphatase MutT (NUDIX family)